MKKAFVTLTSIITALSLLISSYSMTNAHAINIQLPYYPNIQQSGDNCWAYTILSMYRYKCNSNYTINQIYSAFYAANGYSYTLDNGATLLEAYNVISYLFSNYSPSYIVNSLSNLSIILNISNGNPVYISGKDDNNFTNGHAVSLIGYSYTANPLSVSSIRYMNTQNAQVDYHA